MIRRSKSPAVPRPGGRFVARKGRFGTHLDRGSRRTLHLLVCCRLETTSVCRGIWAASRGARAQVVGWRRAEVGFARGSAARPCPGLHLQQVPVRFAPGSAARQAVQIGLGGRSTARNGRFGAHLARMAVSVAAGAASQSGQGWDAALQVGLPRTWICWRRATSRGGSCCRGRRCEPQPDEGCMSEACGGANRRIRCVPAACQRVTSLLSAPNLPVRAPDLPVVRACPTYVRAAPTCTVRLPVDEGPARCLPLPHRPQEPCEDAMSQNQNEPVTRWAKVPAWWLVHPGIDADRFCLLAALATYADASGRCTPSQATLARHLQRSRPWVNRVVGELAAAGFLAKAGRRRENGGTSSCVYQLALAAPGTEPAVQTGSHGAASSACPAADTPCHGADTTQPEPEHTRQTRPRAQAKPQADTSVGGGKTDVGQDWQPSEAALARATAIAPGMDRGVHAAMFVSRCRSKGYRYAAAALDDAWLSWFAEDALKQGRRSWNAAPAGSASRRRADQAEVADSRFHAWAAAAATPPSNPSAWS